MIRAHAAFTSDSKAPAPSGILQRQCACGSKSSGKATCPACSANDKKQHGHHSGIEHTKRNGEVSPSVLTVQNFEAEGSDSPAGRSPVGHDFSALQRRPDSYGLGIGHSLSRSSTWRPQLTIGASHDPLETEADRIADQVISGMSHSAVSVGAAGVQRSSSQSMAGTDTAPSSVTSVLATSGESMMPSLRTDMERRFGHDFSQVKVHSGIAAEQSARDVNAKAYTVGNHIVFGAGALAPETAHGRRLFAHELTHVLQQTLSGSNSQSRCLQREDKDKKPTDPDSKDKTKSTKNKAEIDTKYDTEKEAEAEAARLRALGIDEVEVITRNKRWVVLFKRRSEKEAEKEAKQQQPKLATGLEAGTAYDNASASFYVKIFLKCPDGVPAKVGFHIWPECFVKTNARKRADAKLADLSAGYGTAELFERKDASGFAIYYKPLTQADLTAQQKAAEAQLDSEKKQKPMDKCPTGFTDKGKFRLTTYFVPLEQDFPATPVKPDPLGLKGYTFRDKFLDAVVLQGSGVSVDGDYIKFVKKEGKNFRYAISDCNRTKTETCATIGRTVAVDKSVIPLGSKLMIDGVGERIAEDTGDMINGDHIDIFRGVLSKSVAMKLTLNDKQVCLKK